MIPEIFRLSLGQYFSIPLYSFGLMMLLCFVGSMLLLQKCLSEVGHDPALAESMVTYAAVGGIIGARLFSILSNLDQLLLDPITVIFSSAGFVFYGGFIGGVVGVYIFLRKNSLRFTEFLNIVAAPLAFGYAIGRLGCQLSGDGDYGIASSLPWAMNYAHGVVPTEILVHPAPVYESLVAMVLAIFLTNSKVKRYFGGKGQLFGLYLLVSAVSRFLFETIRIEPLIFGQLSQAQIISIPLTCIGLYLIRRRLNEP